MRFKPYTILLGICIILLYVFRMIASTNVYRLYGITVPMTDSEVISICLLMM